MTFGSDRNFWDPADRSLESPPKNQRKSGDFSFSNPHLIQLFPPISADSRNPPWIQKEKKIEAVGPSSWAFEAVQWTLRSLLVAPPGLRSLEDDMG